MIGVVPMEHKPGKQFLGVSHMTRKEQKIKELFEGQLPEKLHVKSLVTFIVPNESGPDQVIRWNAKDIDLIENEYVFIEKQQKKLPRFKRK